MGRGKWLMRACMLAALTAVAACNLLIEVDDFHVCEPEECPKASGECKKAVCDADGKCAEENLEDGTPAATQVSADCKVNVCQGGAVVSQDDDTDVEDDGAACTVDVCSDGIVTHMAAAAGNPCDDGGGKTCNEAGTCVECNDDADCASDPQGDTKCDFKYVCVPPSCMDLTQNGGETDVDCGGSRCGKCEDGLHCLLADDCESNNCGLDNTCIAGTCDDEILNNMQLGETDVDCGGSICSQCGAGEDCVVDSDCLGGTCLTDKCAETCSDITKNQDESDIDCGGICDGCANDKDCMSSADCASNFCSSADAKCAPCSVNANCAMAEFCTNGVCTSDKALGDPCSSGVECMSGFCVDGVCCSAACDSPCKECNLSATCTNTPDGEDDYFPSNACVGVNECDGNGNCLKGQGQSCSVSSQCQSNLYCVEGVCCNSTCGQYCKSCKVGGYVGTCTNIPFYQPDNVPPGACDGDQACDGTGSCKNKPNEPCDTNSDCLHSNCDDGVCCFSPCGEQCHSCGLGGGLFCVPIPAGSDPDIECGGSTPWCNGEGGCGKGDPGVNCVVGIPNACKNGLNGVCPSTGKCP